MVERISSRDDVCKGSTSLDQIKALVYDNEPKEGRLETFTAANGIQVQLHTSSPHYPQFGDKEFPHSRIGSSLVTRQHEGEPLTSDDLKMLAGYRQFPNSDSMGYMAGLQKQGKLTPEMAAEFADMKREAGCLKPAKVKPAKVTRDGSIEFPAQSN